MQWFAGKDREISDLLYLLFDPMHENAPLYKILIPVKMYTT